ncbi:MAG: hypothetical protein ACRD1V_05350 [Vicinamibacterales bacterium]
MLRNAGKTLFVTTVLTLTVSYAFAQTPGAVSHETRSTVPDEANLATPTGHELSAGVASYTYREPGAQAITIRGAKFEATYTGTRALNKRRRWFAQAQVRGTLGSVGYNGWCSPYLIAPNSGSPNGYELDIGDPSPCTENGDKDWYLEARALAGKDIVGQRWAWSPYSGVGLRHLSNGTGSTPGYRIDDYLYVPVGLTTRTNVLSRKTLSFNAEFDALIHGWQRTHDSYFGSFDVPATPTAPAFTVDGFTDIAFSQSRGWALRASAKYPVTAHWSLEPYYVHWQVGSSPVNDETTTFTVNTVTAREQVGFYEPFNVTNEFGVRLGLHF